MSNQPPSQNHVKARDGRHVELSAISEEEDEDTMEVQQAQAQAQAQETRDYSTMLNSTPRTLTRSPAPSFASATTSQTVIDESRDRDANERKQRLEQEKENANRPQPNLPRLVSGRALFAVITYTPQRARYDPANPPQYSLWLNVLFGLAGMCAVANLYYNHPILEVLAHDFDVAGETASHIPVLAQAGYATGLLFINPMADFVRRRPFVLLLMGVTAVMWIGLCVTESFRAFLGLTYLSSVTTVTPQLMLPLVADLAPAERRATAISIVTSGLLLGMLFARIISGVMATFMLWRYIYWFAFGLQMLVLVILWLLMPDFPRTNRQVSYWRALWSTLHIMIHSPLLVQCSAIGFMTAACFASFWTTLTFLLSDSPYNYTPLVIGLFGLVAVATTTLGPPFSRFVIDKFEPLYGAMLGSFIGLVGIIIGTYTGSFTVAGPVIMAVATELGYQISQISNRSSIYGIDPKARNRVNTAYMVCLFCGQLMGTAVGNRLYASGGWLLSGQASIGFMGAALLFCLARGPRETRWLGWHGGWSPRRDRSHLDAVRGPSSKIDEESPAQKKGRKRDQIMSYLSRPRGGGDTRHAAAVPTSKDHHHLHQYHLHHHHFHYHHHHHNTPLLPDVLFNESGYDHHHHHHHHHHHPHHRPLKHDNDVTLVTSLQRPLSMTEQPQQPSDQQQQQRRQTSDDPQHRLLIDERMVTTMV